MKPIAAGILGFIGLIAACSASNSDTPPPAEKPVSGPQRLWEASCGYCHGGPMNAPTLFGRNLPEDVVIMFARNGANGMPPFPQSSISDADMRALARWIKEQPAPEPGK